MKKLYDYVSMIENRVNNNKHFIGSPYTDLACDIKADIEMHHPQYNSDVEFLAYVKGRMHSSDMEQAYRDFIRNYRAWLRRRKME